MVWSSARRKIYLHIDLSRCISLYFLSASVALNILSVYQLFHDFENFMSLFGRFQFLPPTHSWCLFLHGIFSYIALYITWKPAHVQCKHKIFLIFIFVLITYIPFLFSFSLLHNSSSFYQCLHFVWHVMYKFLTKILYTMSFILSSYCLF